MKKILIFSLAYYPQVGGAEIAIKEITNRLDDIEFHLITMRFSRTDARHEKVGKIIVHRVGKGTRRSALIGQGSSYFSKIIFISRAAFTARRLHTEIHFDGIWAMMTYMLFPVALAHMLGLRIPYALTLQDGDPFERVFRRWRIRFFLPVLQWGFRNATAISAISFHLAAWGRRMGYKDEVAVIPNGADIAHFVGGSIAHAGIVLITTSRLVHKNAIDDVIKALALLPQDITFKILGSGSDKLSLKALAQKEGVEGRVEFLGHIDHRDMPAYLHSADIFIRPSSSEGQGSSFIEAMAAGLPVIATQEGGIADFLYDEKRNPKHPATGFAVDVDSPPQIAERVQHILRDPERTAEIVQNARRLVTEKYDWDTIARNMQECVFEKLV